MSDENKEEPKWNPCPYCGKGKIFSDTHYCQLCNALVYYEQISGEKAALLATTREGQNKGTGAKGITPICSGCGCLWPEACVCGKRESHPEPVESRGQNGLAEISDKIMRKVLAQREEIIEAFLAKYGYGPEEVIQCSMQDGRWFVRRMTEAEKLLLSAHATKSADGSASPKSEVPPAAAEEQKAFNISAADKAKGCRRRRGRRFRRKRKRYN